MTTTPNEAQRSWDRHARLDGDIVTWTTNGQHPFPDMTAAWVRLGLITQAQADVTDAARRAASDRFLLAYAKQQAENPPSEEALAEMRAAFGPGETVVDVATGRRIRL